MGSQLNITAACLKSDPDNYEYPLIHAGAAPTYDIPAVDRPPKRLRLGQDTLATSEGDDTAVVHWPDESPLQPSSSSTRLSAAVHGPSQDPTASSHKMPVTQAQPKRRRKKKDNPPPSSDPFILEHRPFPKHQPWLKVKPRQRKAAVEVNDSVPVPVPASEAPDEGEALVLNKHADRIAALIAKKRRDNDSTKFRQRMALQQRLHRGEKDDSDQAIAASHDELQRKMKLSAQGVYEERPPEIPEPDLRTSDRSSLESAEELVAGDFMAYRNASQHTTPSTDPNSIQEFDQTFDPSSLEVSDRSDVDDGLEETDIVGVRYDSPPPPAPPILGAYVHYPQTAYYQQTILTNRVMAVSGPAPRAQVVENIYAPHAYPSHYPEASPVWGPSQPWATQQMYHALPSTQTPELERAELARRQRDLHEVSSIHHDPSLSYIHPTTQETYDFYATAPPHSVSNTTNPSSTSSTPAAGPVRIPHQNTIPSSSTPAAAVETDSITLRSNMNMFTRQARENGVIGGNNNVVLPTTTRRNMFDRG